MYWRRASVVVATWLMVTLAGGVRGDEAQQIDVDGVDGKGLPAVT